METNGFNIAVLLVLLIVNIFDDVIGGRVDVVHEHSQTLWSPPEVNI